MTNVVLRVVGLTLLLLCALLIMIGGSVASPVDDGASPAIASEGVTNDTVRHENPDEYGDDRGLDATVDWLSGWLSDQLGDSAVSISESEYDLARDIIGDGYDDRLDQFVEVAGETDGSGSDETDDDEKDSTEAYKDAADEQERLADLVEAYRETKTAYEQARDAGDEDLALTLARELEELATEIDELGGSLLVNYEIIEFETESDLSTAKETINETVDDVQEEQVTVRNEQFVETSLEVNVADENGSLVDPISATGQLTTADNSTLANQQVHILVDGEQTTVDTDDNASFSFEYRPKATTALSTSEINVRYLPDDQSAYLGTETSMNVTISQVESEITALESTETAGYGDEISIAGEVRANESLVDSVPVVVDIGGESLGELSTTNGIFDETISLPADVPAGTQSLEVRLPLEEQALSEDRTDTPIEISETETALSIDVDVLDNTTIQINGALETSDGEQIPYQQVTISPENSTEETVVTDSNGEFTELLSAPSTADEEMSIVATFDGDGTNLIGASTEQTVTLPMDASLATGSDGLSWAQWMIVVITLLTIGVLVRWWLGREKTQPAESSHENTVPDTPTSEPAEPRESPLASILLSRAQDQLSRGETEDAIRTSYTAVRHACASIGEEDHALTHWEFYTTFRNRDTTDRDEGTLRQITEDYEQAAFSPDRIEPTVADRVLERATDLCGIEEEPRGDHPPVADD